MDSGQLSARQAPLRPVLLWVSEVPVGGRVLLHLVIALFSWLAPAAGAGSGVRNKAALSLGARFLRSLTSRLGTRPGEDGGALAAVRDTCASPRSAPLGVRRV